MINYNSPQFDKQREWIVRARNEHNLTWETIYYGMGNSDGDLKAFLEQQHLMNFWNVSTEDWKKIVESEKEGEERRLNVSIAQRGAIIGEGYSINDVNIPALSTSCWQKYRRYLLDEQHFLYDDVREIENSTVKILRRMNADTAGDPIKGLVVGNVQSGKTANMAALISMAADHGFNMFIVLSGTIENLRIQTLNRLLKDLNRDGCNLSWMGIPHPSLKCGFENKAQNMNYNVTSHNRYLTVCLKNSTRLKDLIQWLHEDKNSAAQMKILVIDDESDQAGINTKDVDKEERTRINELIVNLVANLNEKGEATDSLFKAMNYIGYTATPYANVLNEAGIESLYPRNFVSTLQVSKTYFGPQQIFGDRNSGDYKGLNIVREISLEDVREIKSIHNGTGSFVPKSFEDAIAWFLCCVAVRRMQGAKDPVSMLVHTSQITNHHQMINDLIENWFCRTSDYIIEKCKVVWEQETEEFTKEDLFENYPGFAVDRKSINDYPCFDEIKDTILQLLDAGVERIALDEDKKLTYKRGIHLCIDNCKSSGIKADGTYLRLAYPNASNNPGFATAFIVVGGATLSRGLTIKGLVSTYFLRSTKQGDTLMQMGRWFGYRRGYELLQRIWITDNALHQFEFLADLDSELRSYISQMEMFGKTPMEYAVIVKQSPSANLIRISAKNKMQKAISAELNFSGMHSQTQLFYDSEESITDNYKLVEKFIRSLGSGIRGNGELGKNSTIWRDIKFESIYDNLLSQYEFHEKLIAFSELEAISEWIKKMTSEGRLDNWNVILFGVGDKNKSIDFGGNTVGKVKRTRKMIRKGTIDLGVLTDPKEKVADVIADQLPLDVKKLYNSYKTENAHAIRVAAGLGSTPSLVIYIIDKNSSIRNEKSNRFDLNAIHDIAGLSINIPGDRINSSYTASVMIDLSNYFEESDIEDEDYEN